MEKYLVLVVVLIIIYMLFELNQRDAKDIKKQVLKDIIKSQNAQQSVQPIYFNMDLNKICGAATKDKKADDEDPDAKYKNLSECERSKIKMCPKEKTIEEQLEEQKQLVKNLQLQINDKTPLYDFNKNDRYFIDTELDMSNGDDIFAMKMQDIGRKPKEATIARSMWSKNSLIPYLEEELQMHENSCGWWEDENLEALM
jgi:hypothetical protein